MRSLAVLAFCVALAGSLAAQSPFHSGGSFNVQANANVTLRLLAFGIPIDQSSSATVVTGTARTIARLSQRPSQPVDIAATQIQALRVEAFDLAAADATLTLRGLRIDLRGFRYRMGDCEGSTGNVSITPGGLGQVLLDQLDARASFLGALVLSGGTPPFAFNQTIDLATLGTGDLDIRGIYTLVPGPNGIGVRQQLAVSPFNLDRFTFGGFELELQITLAQGQTSLVGQAPFEATRQVCCAANTPVGSFFDRLGAADVPDMASGVVAADLDGDGFNDLAWAAGDTVIRFATGAANFSAPLIVPVATAFQDLAAGDLDGDGDLDLVALGLTELQVIRNLGGRSFAPVQVVDIGLLGKLVALGDVDGDRDLDAVVGSGTFSSANCQLLRNDGAGQFLPPTSVTFSSAPADLSLADIDGDSDLDLVATLSSSDFFAFRRNDGTGVFQTAVGFNLLTRGGDDPRRFAMGDIDRDGDLDAVVVHRVTNNVIVIRNANGLFSSASFQNLPIAGTVAADQVELADIDLDGDLDLVVADTGANVASGTHRVVTLRNDGTGVFGSPSNHDLAFQGRSLVVADLDGDLDPEIVSGDHSGSSKVLVNGCSGAVRLATVLAFGTSCPGSVGTPQLTALGRPIAGRRFESRLEPLVQGTALFAIGFSNTTWNGLPLPLALQPFGFGAGCAALVSVDIVEGVTHGGIARHSLSIPSLASLAGAALFLQGYALDPALPVPLPMVVSNALALTIGA